MPDWKRPGKKKRSTKTTRNGDMDPGCLVIMPFGQTRDRQLFSDLIYDHVIMPAIELAGVRPERIDRRPLGDKPITGELARLLETVDVVPCPEVELTVKDHGPARILRRGDVDRDRGGAAIIFAQFWALRADVHHIKLSVEHRQVGKVEQKMCV